MKQRISLARVLKVAAAALLALAVLAGCKPKIADKMMVQISYKGTLTDGLIAALRRRGEQVAVLAVDPTSPFTGGAVLGDRVRMQDHASDPGVFIRSMASRGHLGGLSAAAPKGLTLLDAAGFPYLLIETVGVGQDEVEVADAADTTVVVVTPGWGDGIQAAKAGILEIGDVFVVNKADRPGVDDAVADLRTMLAMGGERSWAPPILTTVAFRGSGVAEVLDSLLDHRRHLEESGALEEGRLARRRGELRFALAAAYARRAASELARTDHSTSLRTRSALMAMAAADPAPAAVMTCARGSATLPAAHTPEVVVRPVASVVTNPASSNSQPSPARSPSG